MCYGYHIWSKEVLMQGENDDDLDGGQRSSEVKWGKLCAMATIFGQKKHWHKLRMMMTLMEVKGHQRSNGVNYVLWLPYLVKRITDAWQMPIKYLICIIYAKIGPEHFSGTVCPTWMIFGMWVGLGPKMRMVTLMEVKGHQRSNGVK